MLLTNLSNLMSDRQGWANLNMIPTSGRLEREREKLNGSSLAPPNKDIEQMWRLPTLGLGSSVVGTPAQ